jgi:hypothetical protein
MLSLGELLVKAPEDLHDTESTTCDRIREITTWWTDSSDNADTSLTIWTTKSNNTTSTLVEACLKLGSDETS